MRCRDCLIWRKRLGDNEAMQLETVPRLARVGFTSREVVSNLYRSLDSKWRGLISLMDTECPMGKCIIGDAQDAILGLLKQGRVVNLT